MTNTITTGAVDVDVGGGKTKKMKKNNKKKSKKQQKNKDFNNAEERNNNKSSVINEENAVPTTANDDRDVVLSTKKKRRRREVDFDDDDGVNAVNDAVTSAPPSSSSGGGKQGKDKRRSKKRKRPSPSKAAASSDDNDVDAEGGSARGEGSNNNKKNSSLLSPDAPTPPPPRPNSFESVNPPLSSGILTAVSSYNFHTMTPVQSTVIPLFLTHKDVCVQAVTGSGKTLAFLIPMIEMILRRTTLLKQRQIGGLVISPTRELARQTHTVALDLCRRCSLSEPLLLVGGGGKNYRPVSSDLSTFRTFGSDIIVGTPGRIDDILSRYDDVDVTELECLVLDEADVLLDMGFEVTLTNLLSRLPKMRRTGLFSATKTSPSGLGAGGSRGGGGGIKQLMARAGLRNPVVVNVAIARAAATAADAPSSSKGGSSSSPASSPMTDDAAASAERDDAQVDRGAAADRIQHHQQATPTSLTNYYLITPLDHKLSRLVSFLQQHARNDKIIVFFLTCASVEFYGGALKHIFNEHKGYYLELLHGKLAQKRREKAMERFRNRGGDGGEDNGDGDGNGEGGGGVLLCTDVAARGLDVTDVKWTVQFDAPVDPSSYVHRVGRSARAGRVGSSLLFLCPNEESYVDLLRMRKVPLHELPATESCAVPTEEDDDDDDEVDDGDGEDDQRGAAPASSKGDTETDRKGKNDVDGVQTRIIPSATGVLIPDILPKVRNLVLNDRDLLEKGTKAFTSYVRAYKEHHCAFIFRFASLDLGLLATSFCLLRLPKMPELKDKLGKLNFTPAGPEVDIHAIKFKDKLREKARQKRLAAELAAGGKNAKQIKAEQRAAEKIRRQKERREAEIAKGRNPNKKRGKQARIFDEWDELAKEERLHKKLRSGKITKEKYKALMYGDGVKEGTVPDDDLMDSDVDT